jgi:hypothetical protein
MPVKEITEKTYLIMDNCVLSMMTEWYCQEKRGLSCTALLEQTHAWLHGQIELFQSFTVDGLLHTSTSVSAEYIPWHESCELRKRGVETPKIQAMAGSVRSRFNLHEVDALKTKTLRTLPGVNLNLVKKLTHQDLSLVHVGLSLSCSGHQVYILSNDQDLLQYISWARTQKSLKTDTLTPQLIEGLSGITFMDLVHRGCFISSEQMMKMVAYTINDTNERMQRNDPMALNKDKGTKILVSATQMLSTTLLKSIELKLAKKGDAA